MKKLTKKGAHPMRFTLNEKYNLARDAEVNKMLSEFVSEQDRITARRVRNMLHALLEEK